MNDYQNDVLKMSPSDRIIPWIKAAVSPAENPLKVAVVFQDALTRSWVSELCERARQLLGTDTVRCTGWKLSDLGKSVVFADAVLDALQADVIVVSIHSAAELPDDLCVWIEAWLPHRSPQAGALVALLGVPETPFALSSLAQQHLRAVARRGGLDLLLEERNLPVEPLTFSSGPTFESHHQGNPPAQEEFRAE